LKCPGKKCVLYNFCYHPPPKKSLKETWFEIKNLLAGHSEMIRILGPEKIAPLEYTQRDFLATFMSKL